MSANVGKRCGCRDPETGKKLGRACPQLRRADGSYNPSHGSWFARTGLEPGPDGERREFYRTGYATKADAVAAIEEAKGAQARGVDPTRKVSVGVFLTEWLAGKQDLRPTTRRGYVQHVTDYLVPHLGRIEIGQLRRHHVEAMFTALGLKPATAQRVRATLRSALADAEREGLVLTNAARLARLASGRRPKVEVLEPAELGQLLDHVAHDRLGPLFEVIAATGLRRGEGLALRWRDVDLDNARLTVRQQLTQLPGRHDCPHCDGHTGVAFAPPKTASGVARTVDLPARSVFCSRTGSPRTPTGRTRWAAATPITGSASPVRTATRFTPTR